MAECFIMRRCSTANEVTDTYTENGLLLSSGVSGHTGATLLISNASMYCTNGVTLECCVRIDAIPNDAGRVVTLCSDSKGDSGTSRLIIGFSKKTSVAASSDFSCNYTANLTGSSEADKYYSISDLHFGEIHTYSLAVDEGVVKMYSDGELLVGDYTITTATPTMKTLGAMYGLNRTDRTLTGELYSARVYNRALSADEVLENYNIDKINYGSGV